MRKLIFTPLLLCLLAVATLSSCKPENPEVPKTNPHEYVNSWIYKQMNIYYLWNDKIPQKPDYTLAPKAFFGSLLNTYNEVSNPEGDRFSWIQEDYTDLLNSLSGVSSGDIGFEYIRIKLSETSDQYYLLVLYPKIGSDAHAKGIKRGQWVTGIDGNTITSVNISSLLSGLADKTLSMAEWQLKAGSDKYEITPTGNVTVRMHEKFAENPIYKDSVYTLPSGKKVGYLVYNFFANDNGDNSYSYDAQLMNTLADIKAAGATDFVLDLRYNGGGAVSSAVALASALVKDRSTSKVFAVSRYNALVEAELGSRYGADFNKDYFIDKVLNEKREVVAQVPSLNLSTLYVLVSRWSASASELIINGLRSADMNMRVVLIGEKTYGKNVGSISLYEKNDPKNKWGMQPIVVKSYNSEGKSDYSTGFTPNYDISVLGEDNNLRLIELGVIEEPMLNKALSLIEGTSVSPAPRKAPKMATEGLRTAERTPASLDRPDRNVMIDDIRGEQIRELIREKLQE